jgi:hypothetical protein
MERWTEAGREGGRERKSERERENVDPEIGVCKYFLTQLLLDLPLLLLTLPLPLLVLMTNCLNSWLHTAAAAAVAG